MPKYDRDLMHFFMTKALTDRNTDLAVYNNRDFLQDLRLVAVNSILAILHKIHSEQVHAKKHGRTLRMQDVINMPHPVTGLNMLDYCLVAGLEDLATQLMQAGATSSHMQSFNRKITRTFSAEVVQPEIMENVSTIVNDFLKIKQRVDQLVATTNEVMPGCIAAVRNLWAKKSSPAVLVGVGIGAVVLGPVVYPLVHHASSALVLSAVGIPALVSGVNATQSGSTATVQLQDSRSEEDIVKSLIHTSKQFRKDLQGKDATRVDIYSRQKPRKIDTSKKPTLLHHLVKHKPQQSVSKNAPQLPQFGR